MTMRHAAARLIIVLAVFAACAVLANTQLLAQPAAEEEPAAPVPAAATQSKEVAEAQERFQKLDFDGALLKLNEACAKDPGLPPAEVIMATWFAMLPRGEGANGVRYYLDLAVAEHRDDPQAYIFLGGIALRERHITEAELLYGKANELMAKFQNAERKAKIEPAIYAGLADVAGARQDWPTEQKHLETLLKLDPENMAAKGQLAVALFQQKKTAQARDNLKQAYEGILAQAKAKGEANQDPLHWGAQMALLYENSGDHDQAKTWMDFALKSAPNSLSTWLEAARWSLQTGQIDQAEQQAAKAMQLDEKSLAAKVLRGVVALYKKDYRAAELYFENAHLQSPSTFVASNNLALALCEQDAQDKKTQALEYASNNARQYADRNSRWYTEAASTLGWVLYKNGRLDDADRVLSQLARSGRISEDTAYYLARVAADKGRADEAKTLLEKALKSKTPFSKPDSPVPAARKKRSW
jgi:tetratricopeptide (TPR) repeat protein